MREILNRFYRLSSKTTTKATSLD